MSIRTSLFAFALVAVAAAGFPGRTHAAKEKFERTKPHVNIGVFSEGLDLRGFVVLSGLGVDTEAIDAAPGSERKRPGRTKWSDITLKRGYTGATDVYDWATEGVAGELSLRDLHIALLTPSAEPVARYDLFECFPVHWEVSTDADGKGIATETIVVTCGRVELVR